MMSAAAAGIPIPSGLAGTWSGNVTFSPMGPRSTQLPNGGASFLEVSTLGVDGSFFMRQMAFDQLFRVPAKHGTAVQVRHRLQCSECGTVSVRPAVTAHSRDPQGRAPLSPREPGGQVGWPLSRPHRADVWILDFDFGAVLLHGRRRAVRGGTECRPGRAPHLLAGVYSLSPCRRLHGFEPSSFLRVALAMAIRGADPQHTVEQTESHSAKFV